MVQAQSDPVTIRFYGRIDEFGSMPGMIEKLQEEFEGTYEIEMIPVDFGNIDTIDIIGNKRFSESAAKRTFTMLNAEIVQGWSVSDKLVRTLGTGIRERVFDRARRLNTAEGMFNANANLGDSAVSVLVTLGQAFAGRVFLGW